MEVYLDNSATTKAFLEVAELVKKLMCEDYGNPSSLHRKGVQAENHLRYAKETFAKILKVSEKEIYFTSVGTESDNLALIGCALANRRKGMHLITTQIEHPAVLQTMKYLESLGFRVTYLPVDRSGCIRLEDLKNAMTAETILVSIMHTNNEVGSLQPIAEAGELIKRMNPSTLFHVDAVQGFGKAKIYPKKMHIDLLSASGHKIHGPKGVGLLYIQEKVKIQAINYGGGQQMNLRSGTENVPGIAGMAKAAELLYGSLDQDLEQLYRCKQHFIDGVRRIEGVQVNGLPDCKCVERTAPHVVSVSFAGVRSEVLLHALEEAGIYVSAGSACSAHKPQPSATLKAMGVDPKLLSSTIRFSFSVFTTMEELDYTLQVLYDKIPMLRKYTRRA
ncbi:MAG: cysteine desulfurase [Lachnospiraceae bacterium]|nr:cysteine desulfurase [Lachnospiraceae bacterium]